MPRPSRWSGPASSCAPRQIGAAHGQGKKSIEGLARGRQIRRLAEEAWIFRVPQGRFDPELSSYHIRAARVSDGLRHWQRMACRRRPLLCGQVQALQLQGYLLFYDQVLADYSGPDGEHPELVVAAAGIQAQPVGAADLLQLRL